MLDGVAVVALRKIPDERGMVMHMLRADAPHFEQFGEIYFSTAYPGVTKGWTIHRQITVNYAVLVGMVKLVLYDPRRESSTYGQLQTVFMGEDNYVLVKIPQDIVSGWQCLGVKPAILANCATEPHRAGESQRLPLDSPDVPYEWLPV